MMLRHRCPSAAGTYPSTLGKQRTSSPSGPRWVIRRVIATHDLLVGASYPSTDSAYKQRQGSEGQTLLR